MERHCTHSLDLRQRHAGKKLVAAPDDGDAVDAHYVITRSNEIAIVFHIRVFHLLDKDRTSEGLVAENDVEMAC